MKQANTAVVGVDGTARCLRRAMPTHQAYQPKIGSGEFPTPYSLPMLQ